MERVAFITGVNGQDGSYLADFLLQKGYAVYGFGTQECAADYVAKEVHYVPLDIVNDKAFEKLLDTHQPDEVYNLAGLSSVSKSFENPELTYEVNGMAVLRLLKAIQRSEVRNKKQIRVYQASSSEMFGNAPLPQSEDTPFRPLSPYACAKILAHYTAGYFRKAYGMFIVCGILFNHESPRRPETFVTRKITKAVAAIKKGTQKELLLGDLSVRRDWGYAPEYMEAAWRMVQAKEANDYVIGTGVSHSLEDFVRLAFEHAGLGDYSRYVKQDSALLRPADVKETRANPQKAATLLNWKANTDFSNLVRIMVEADMKKE